MDPTGTVKPEQTPEALAELPLRPGPHTKPITKRQLKPEEWAALRPVIEQLYIVEGKTFEKVANLLQEKYNFHPTKRQFHRRIVQWGLRKNTKQEERQMILEKLSCDTKKGRIGTVRLNPDKLLRWRKEVHTTHQGDLNEDEGAFQLPTASSRSRSPSLVVVSDHGEPIAFYDSIQEMASHVQELPENAPISVTSASMMLQHISENPKMPPSPTQPFLYQLPEELFYTIRTYMDGSWASGVWQYEEGRGCYNIHMDPTNMSLESILGSCNTAGMLVKSKSFVEARRVLSKMFGLMREIIENEHPDTLDYLLLACWYLEREGLPDIIILLKNYIGEMATVVSRHNPWRRICQIIGAMEPKQFRQAWHGAFSCIIDAQGRNLGPLHETTLVTIDDRARLTTPEDQETVLRALLEECDRASSTAATKFKLLGPLARCLREQGKYAESEKVALEFLEMAKVDGEPTDLNRSYQFCAEAQNMLKKYDLAEASQRAAAKIVEEENSEDRVVYVIRLLKKLEVWMREWPGREEDADKLRAEINELIELDEIDKEEVPIEISSSG